MQYPEQDFGRTFKLALRYILSMLACLLLFAYFTVR